MRDMEPEPAKAPVKHENEIKPELLINNKDDDFHKQPSEKNTPPRLSSSSSASSSLSLEFAADENDLPSGPDDPWSMLSASSDPALSTDSGYDPNRIPASIFSTKVADGWSLASNESLFSIHMGNNSFSRDHAILCEKSGELGRLDDWNETELMVSTGGLSTVIEETSGGLSRVDSFNKGPDLVSSKSLSMPRTSRASTNRLSDDSRNSCASFAFPVLVGDGVKTGGSSRKGVTEQQRSEEVCNTPPPQQGLGEQGGGYWYSRLCCCCCCWPRCC